MTEDLQGRTAIVTGGASGLGRATVEEFIRRGAAVAIFDLNAEGAAQVAEQNPDRCMACEVNVTDEASVTAGLDAVQQRFGPIYYCVNCAGGGDAARTVGRNGPYPLEQFRRVVELNIIGSFNMVRLVADRMQHNSPLGPDGDRGVIVNVGSVAGIDGQIGQVAYAAGKAGIIGMTLPIARDLGRLSIRINTICPGVFDTAAMQLAPEEMRERLAQNAQFPKRLGRPAEFAQLVLAITDNPYMNGETLRLDAAMRMPPR